MTKTEPTQVGAVITSPEGINQRPACIYCQTRTARWPTHTPMFCTQRCAAAFGVLEASETYELCEHGWHIENCCPSCSHAATE